MQPGALITGQEQKPLGLTAGRGLDHSLTALVRIATSRLLKCEGDNWGRSRLSVSLLSAESAGTAEQERRLYYHDWYK